MKVTSRIIIEPLENSSCHITSFPSFKQTHGTWRKRLVEYILPLSKTGQKSHNVTVNHGHLELIQPKSAEISPVPNHLCDISADGTVQPRQGLKLPDNK